MLPLPLSHRAIGFRVALSAGLLLAVSACATLDGLMGAARVPVLDGAVTVAAPSGYCVGPGTVEESQDTAVVLIGRCLATGLVAPAVITVSVGAAGSSGVLVAGAEALADFFATSEGRALLARSGRPQDVSVIETRAQGDVFLMHLQDIEAGDYWRAILGLNGRLITVSAQGTGRVVLASTASLKAVTHTLQAMQAANPAVVAAVVPPILPEGATQRPPGRPAAGWSGSR